MIYEEQLGLEIEKLREVVRIQSEIIESCAEVERLLADLAWGEVICDEVPWEENNTFPVKMGECETVTGEAG